MNLIDRAKNIIITPQTEWAVIEPEPTPVADLYRDYIIPLAAIPAVAEFIGSAVIGYSVPVLGGTYRVPFFSGLVAAVVHYLLGLALIWVVAQIVARLAPNFGGQQNEIQAFKLTAYAYTPGWIAGIFSLIPGLRWLAILGLWGIYLFYLGVPRMTKCPPEKAMIFTVAVVVATIVLGLVIGGLVALIAPGPRLM
jgi:hypothetical protein